MAMSRHGLMACAYKRALCSTDDSTQNAAVLAKESNLVVSGHNVLVGLSRDDVGDDRALKYRHTIHAEVDVLCRWMHGRYPGQTADMTMYCPWAPCIQCAKMILYFGLDMLVVHEDRMKADAKVRVKGRSEWSKECREAIKMLERCGVPVFKLKGPVDAEPILVGGKLWSPRELKFVPWPEDCDEED